MKQRYYMSLTTLVLFMIECYNLCHYLQNFPTFFSNGRSTESHLPHRLIDDLIDDPVVKLLK